ncbi:hypothetical protein CMUST_15770 (plasmid) [Corynebacterium mustelae]|uniref:Uncharacterized protein n=2 Tax=Corynebacterium mustelae TaxID=571915 RepID=A0A0G3H2C4_9CORY|nr:hypothetical protein CMUST_04450 [Corynebacterium mustelae]AKK07442.1 hypothetical protein CMUST_15770 [Corynebacterium mustelae]
MSVEPIVIVHTEGSDSFSRHVVKEIEQRVLGGFPSGERPILRFTPTQDDFEDWIGYFCTLKDISPASIKAIDRVYRELEANTDWSIELDWAGLEYPENFDAVDDFGNHVRNRERLRT